MKKHVAILSILFFAFIVSLYFVPVAFAGDCCYTVATRQCEPKPRPPMDRCQTGEEIDCSSQPTCNATMDCCRVLGTGQCSHKPVTGCGAGTQAISCASDPKCSTAPAPVQPPASSGAITFINPIKFDSVEGVVTSLLDHLMAVIAWIAVLFIVIGGLMYMLAVGDDKKITTAKNIIGAAIIGFAIAIAAPTFLHEVAIILGYDTTSSPTVENAITIKVIVERTLDLLLSIVGIIAIIGLVVGGMFYLTAYGDEDRAKKGKSIITSSIIGIVVALAALMIVKQVFELLV